MALKITSSISFNDGGSSTTTYSRIDKYIIKKDREVAFYMEHYRSKIAADSNKDTIHSDALKEVYHFPIVTAQWRTDNEDDGIYNFIQSELEGTNFFSISYSKLKALFQSETKTIVDA